MGLKNYYYTSGLGQSTAGIEVVEASPPELRVYGLSGVGKYCNCYACKSRSPQEAACQEATSTCTLIHFEKFQKTNSSSNYNIATLHNNFGGVESDGIVFPPSVS